MPLLAQPQFAQQGPKLFPADADGRPFFGNSVALSGDGNTLLVGGPSNGTSGAAWVWVRTNGTWSQQQKLVGSGALGNAVQGSSVALSADGNTALIGGPGDNENSGAAWVFTRSNGVWTQQAKLTGAGVVGITGFGLAVALSDDGNTAAAGGRFDNNQAGAVWIFTRSNGNWSQQGPKLPGTATFGQLGSEVDLSADGNTLLAGAAGSGFGAGSASVFTRSNGVWTQDGPALVGTNAVGAPTQGTSVALSADGTTALIGGPLDDSGAGASWVFVRSNGAWTQQGEKLAGGGSGERRQGFSVSLSADGNIAVIGGPTESNRQGAVSAFVRNGSTWSQLGKFAGSGGAASENQFGFSVAISQDGRTFAAGARAGFQAPGGVWIFAALERYTIQSNPAGLAVRVDGVTATAPVLRDWLPGTAHTIEGVAGLTPGPGSRYLAPAPQSIVAPQAPASYVVSYGLQHQLSTSAVPFVGGAVTAAPPSADGFYNAGTSVQLQAAGSYQFAGWSGGLSGMTNPATVVMDRPRTVLAEFVQPTVCSYTLSRDAVAVMPSGDIGRVSVQAPAGCAWSATVSGPWITLLAGSGTGPGTLRYQIAANDAATLRTGRIRVGGAELAVHQSSAGCTFRLNPAAQIVPATPSAQLVDVQAPAGCQWMPVAGSPWLTTSPAMQTGPLNLAYQAGNNPALLPRVSTISTGGQMLPVLQQALGLQQQYSDVPPSSPFFDFIALAANTGLTGACQGNQYCPDALLTRAEMAEFLIRGLYPDGSFPFPSTPYFTDVPGSHPRFRFIQKLRELGITAGCTANTFCPDTQTNRGQMAVFVTRARLGVTNTQTIPVTQVPYFDDVPGSHPFFAAIQKLRELGITVGCTATSYCPDNAVTKAQMSVFAVRALMAP